ncbi:MAG: hypothetical protein HXS45_04510 [Theionarchaea archaeon]|nr:hypothetical protein [Theionarchaea archaeon]
MGLHPSSVTSRLKEAIDLEYIEEPQVRKKSFSNFRTYVYLSQVQDPLELFDQYTRNKDVIYHELLDGVFNLHVISKEKLDIEGVVLEGIPSDYYISYPPDRPWGRAIDTMRTMVAGFNPEEYVPKGYITTHWDEPVNWSDTDEILYQELKYNMRKALKPLMKKYTIPLSRTNKWIQKLPECCTFATNYFPETLPAYDLYLHMFRTDYEDFIIDLFSQLPTTCWFQRVSDALLVYIWTMKSPARQKSIRIEDITGMQIPFLKRELAKKAIVENEAHAKVKCCWRKEGERNESSP